MSHSHASIRPSQPIRIEGGLTDPTTRSGWLEIEGIRGGEMASLRLCDLTPEQVEAIICDLRTIAWTWREQIATAPLRGKPLIDIL